MRRFLLCIALLTGCSTEFSDPVGVPVPSPDGGAAPLAGEFQRFINCIQLADFQSAGMAQAWSTMVASQTACSKCHADAEYSGNELAFFDALKTRTYVQIRFFTFDGANVEVNEQTIPNVGKGIAPHTSHPKFNATTGMDAVGTLHGFTQTRVFTGNCP